MPLLNLVDLIYRPNEWNMNWTQWQISVTDVLIIRKRLDEFRRISPRSNCEYTNGEKHNKETEITKTSESKSNKI